MPAAELTEAMIAAAMARADAKVCFGNDRIQYAVLERDGTIAVVPKQAA